MKTISRNIICLSLCFQALTAQVITESSQSLTRAALEKAIKSLAATYAIPADSLQVLLMRSYSILGQKIPDTVKTQKLVNNIKSSINAEDATVAKAIAFAQLSGEVLSRGSIAVQSGGTLKANIQAYKFNVAPQSLNLPMYINLSPEVPLTNGKENEKDKAKRILNSTGGNFGLMLKKYYFLTSGPDASFRWDWILSANLASQRDTLNVDNSINGNFLAGLGLNFEAQIIGDGNGFLWIEGSFLHNNFLGDSFSNVFVGNPRDEFWGITALAQLKIINLIEVKFEYHKSINSSISSLDKGFAVFSFGLTTNLKD